LQARAGPQAESSVALTELTEEEQEAQALRLAAYFSQAVADLQFVGMCRPNKKRKQAAMQRLYYPPESLL
jgi:hypothetical protein